MKVKLSNVRLAFPDLFEATQVNGQGDYKFRATFLIPKNRTDLIEAIESAIKQVATAKWGAKADAVLKSIRGNSMRFNFRDGDEKIEYDGYADHMYIGASNKARPLVIDRDRWTPLLRLLRQCNYHYFCLRQPRQRYFSFTWWCSVLP